MSHTYEFARPAATVDGVIFGIHPICGLCVLLIQRKDEPFKNCWALPGGFVEMTESIDQAAARELKEETGISDLYLEQLYTFGDPQRDPRERVISVAYYALVKTTDLSPVAGSDAREVGWFSVLNIPKTLAFDHNNIVNTGLERIRNKIRYQPIGMELLPQRFTLTQLQTVYEAILGYSLDKRNFRRKLKQYNEVLIATKEHTMVGKKKAILYRFDRAVYKKLAKRGWYFEV